MIDRCVEAEDRLEGLALDNASLKHVDAVLRKLAFCGHHTTRPNGSVDACKQHGMWNSPAYLSFLVFDELNGPGGIVLIECRALRRNDHEIGCRYGVCGLQIGNAFGVHDDKGGLFLIL